MLPTQRLHTTISYPESAGQRREDSGDINLIDFFLLAMPFLTEVEYQNKFLHFHWLSSMSGSFMSVPGVAPLTKKPEDSGYEIAHTTT